jgi:hypothetical protein
MTKINSFIKVNTMGAGANGAMTENGAISYSTIGTALLDQFGKAASYRGRDIETVWAEQSILWSENSEKALKFPFYLRMITRQSNITGGKKTEKVQRGAGVRDEAFKRLLWIAKYHPEEFYRNLWLLPVVGSWKDLWVLLTFDGADEYLDENKFFEVFAEGINDPNSKDLVKKYMPRIRSSKKCTTSWSMKTNKLAKHFADAAGWSYKDYRTYKTSGEAHTFQKIICKGLYKNIDWKTIPGKALLNLVSGNFLKKHKLENSYLDWIKSQPIAKFNGYAYELGRKLGCHTYELAKTSLITKVTIDKQFEGLIATASKDNGAIKGNVLCALDTSGSMTGPALDKSGTTPFHVCVSLGIYFSELNQGAFHNTVAMFDDTSTMLTLKGKTFSEKWSEIISQRTAWGSTNFQSIIDLLVKTRTYHPDIPLNDYPETLIVVSDMQFNPTSFNEQTNYELAMNKLKRVFPKEYVDNFKIIWWYCTNRKTNDFPSTMDDAGTYMFSGFDPAVITFLLGGEIPVETKDKKAPSMEDVIELAFNQDVIAMVR